jgi:hypothetical protein
VASGFFDRTTVPAGWFDPLAIDEGWFDEDQVSAAAPTGYTLTALAGSYALTGVAATVSRSRLLTASAGAYVYTGQTATLLRSSLLTAQPGAYSLTGQSATLTFTAAAGAYVLTALPGSYEVTGSSATLTNTDAALDATGGYGFYASYERALKQKRNRDRELEEAEAAQRQLQDETERELARFLQEQERKDAERQNIERLRKLVNQANAAELQDERIRQALEFAQLRQSQASLEKLQREIEKQQDEEAFVLMLLLSD